MAGKPEVAQPALETPLTHTQPTVSTLPATGQPLSPSRQPDGNDAPQTMGVENTSAIIRLTYAFGGQAVATRIINGSSIVYYIHNDHLGSNSRMSTSAGSAVGGSTARYTPFGDWRTEPTATLTNRGYTGHLHNNLGSGSDDLGLIYMNARYYLPASGRFISPDTIVPDPSNPQSWNRYSYVYNSPINLVDTDGHCPAPPTDLGSGRIICVAGFIPTSVSQATGVQFTGNNRDFSATGDIATGSSRFWVWIDTQTGEMLQGGFHETCVVGGECAGPRPIDCGIFNNCVEAAILGDGAIHLDYKAICDSYGAYDLLCGMTVNGEMVFTPANEGGFNAEVVADDFPNLEACYWVDEELVQTIFQIQNFSSEELTNGIANPSTAMEMLFVLPSNHLFFWADPIYTYNSAGSGGAQ